MCWLLLCSEVILLHIHTHIYTHSFYIFFSIMIYHSIVTIVGFPVGAVV